MDVKLVHQAIFQIKTIKVNVYPVHRGSTLNIQNLQYVVIATWAIIVQRKVHQNVLDALWDIMRRMKDLQHVRRVIMAHIAQAIIVRVNAKTNATHLLDFLVVRGLLLVLIVMVGW
jgi:hypothetical protein